MRIKKIMSLLAAFLLCQSAHPMAPDMKQQFLDSIKQITVCDNGKEKSLIVGSLATAFTTEAASNKRIDADKAEIDRLQGVISGWNLAGSTTEAASLAATRVDIPDGFFESVNSAFLKIDILAMPSHVSYSYLLTPMQAKYLKMQVAEDLYKKFTEKGRRWTSFWLFKSPQASAYQDKLVTKVVLEHLKPLIAPKIARLKKDAGKVKAQRKLVEEHRTNYLMAVMTTISQSDRNNELSASLLLRAKQLDAMQNSSYDLDKLYKFRLSVINDTELYSKYQMWFDEYVQYIGEYRKLNRELMEPEVEEKGEVLKAEALAQYKNLFLEALSAKNVPESVNEKIDNILPPTSLALQVPQAKPKTPQTPLKPLQPPPAKASEIYKTRIEEILKMEPEGRSDENLKEEKATQLDGLVKTHKRNEKKMVLAGTKEPAIAGNLDALKKLRTQAAELYALNEQEFLANELSVAKMHVAQNMAMKMISISIVVLIVWAALTSGVIPGAAATAQSVASPGVAAVTTYVQGLVAQYPAIGAIAAQLQDSRFAAFITVLKDSPFMTVFVKFMSTKSAEFLAMVQESQFVAYAKNIDPVEITSYLTTIVQDFSFINFLQGAGGFAAKVGGQGISLFVDFVRNGNLEILIRVCLSLFIGFSLPILALIASNVIGYVKYLKEISGKADKDFWINLPKDKKAMASITNKIKRELQSLSKGGYEFFIRLPVNFIGTYVAAIKSAIIDCWATDPERARHYHIYYTMMELQMSIAEMDLAIARQVDLAPRSKT